MKSLPNTRSKTNRNFVRRVSIKGQVTLPNEVRKVLGIKPRDQVAFCVGANEVRVMSVQPPLFESYQAIPALKTQLSTGKMREVAGEEQAALIAREGIR